MSGLTAGMVAQRLAPPTATLVRWNDRYAIRPVDADFQWQAGRLHMVVDDVTVKTVGTDDGGVRRDVEVTEFDMLRLFPTPEGTVVMLSENVCVGLLFDVDNRGQLVLGDADTLMRLGAVRVWHAFTDTVLDLLDRWAPNPNATLPVFAIEVDPTKEGV